MSDWKVGDKIDIDGVVLEIKALPEDKEFELLGFGRDPIVKFHIDRADAAKRRADMSLVFGVLVGSALTMLFAGIAKAFV